MNIIYLRLTAERVCNVSESNNTELRQSSVGVSSSTDRELDDGETSGVSQPSQSTTSFTPGIHHLEGIPEVRRLFLLLILAITVVFVG